ncbi:MAG: helix-hairpin-helix domain-containing protein [Breznakibacter sp.]
MSRNELVQLGVSAILADSLQARQVRFFVTRKFTVEELSSGSLDSVMERIAYASAPKRIKGAEPSFVLELNSADTTELDLLQGIGPAYARRIVFFRSRLGGYCTLGQLLEVDGISPDLFDKIKNHLTVDASKIKPLNVNKESLRKLKDHPYIGFYKAKEIIDLRKQQGRIASVAQILELPSFQQADKQMVVAYLSVE